MPSVLVQFSERYTEQINTINIWRHLSSSSTCCCNTILAYGIHSRNSKINSEKFWWRKMGRTKEGKICIYLSIFIQAQRFNLRAVSKPKLKIQLFNGAMIMFEDLRVQRLRLPRRRWSNTEGMHWVGSPNSLAAAVVVIAIVLIFPPLRIPLVQI